MLWAGSRSRPATSGGLPAGAIRSFLPQHPVCSSSFYTYFFSFFFFALKATYWAFVLTQGRDCFAWKRQAGWGPGTRRRCLRRCLWAASHRAPAPRRRLRATGCRRQKHTRHTPREQEPGRGRWSPRGGAHGPRSASFCLVFVKAEPRPAPAGEGGGCRPLRPARPGGGRPQWGGGGRRVGESPCPPASQNGGEQMSQARPLFRRKKGVL